MSAKKNLSAVARSLNQLVLASAQKVPSADNEHYVTELELWADNNESLYRQRAAFEENLAKKVLAGRYEHSLAPKLWMYFADQVALDYIRANVDPRGTLNRIPISVRRDYAQALAHDFVSKAVHSPQDLVSPKAREMLQKANQTAAAFVPRA